MCRTHPLRSNPPSRGLCESETHFGCHQMLSPIYIHAFKLRVGKSLRCSGPSSVPRNTSLNSHRTRHLGLVYSHDGLRCVQNATTYLSYFIIFEFIRSRVLFLVLRSMECGTKILWCDNGSRTATYGFVNGTLATAAAVANNERNKADDVLIVGPISHSLSRNDPLGEPHRQLVPDSHAARIIS